LYCIYFFDSAQLEKKKILILFFFNKFKSNRVIELTRKLSQPQVTSIADHHQYQQQHRYDIMSSSSAASSSNRSSNNAFNERPGPVLTAPSHYDEMLLQQARLANNNTVPINQPDIAAGFRRASFNKSTSSPLKTTSLSSDNAKTGHTPSPHILAPPSSAGSPASQQAISEDIEMLSCSSSSSSSSSSSPTSHSSYKDNEMKHQQNIETNDGSAVITNNPPGNENYNSDSNASANEPSKLSLSEKMKLFSNMNNNSNKNGGQTPNSKPGRQGHVGGGNRAANANRFSTQVSYFLLLCK
jgi:hypothetical protein